MRKFQVSASDDVHEISLQPHILQKTYTYESCTVQMYTRDKRLTRDSFVLVTVREWNNLNLSVRNLDTLSKFKKAISSSISMPIPRHYSYGPRKLNIILTQLRCNASFQNYNLCKVNILSNASCNCGAPCENSHHFFFDCDKYTDNREILFNNLNFNLLTLILM